MPKNLSNTKDLQTFLRLVNYARNFIKDLEKIVGPLYSKTSKNGQKHFNQEDIKLVQKMENLGKDLPGLNLPLDTDYIIIKTNGCSFGWGAILKARSHMKKIADMLEESIKKKEILVV